MAIQQIRLHPMSSGWLLAQLRLWLSHPSNLHSMYCFVG